MNWIKSKMLGLFLILLSTLLSVAAFEMFLIFENKSELVERIGVKIEDYDYFFIKKTDTLNHFKKQNNSSDIFVVGDSFVLGEACEANGKNFPSYLQKLISRKYKIVNLGVGGMNPADYIDWLYNLKVEGNDTVIIVLYDNDIHLSSRNCEQIKRQKEKFDIYLPSFCQTPLQNTPIVLDKSNISFFQKLNNKVKHLKTVQLLKETLVNIPFAKDFFYRNEYRNRWNQYQSEENKWMISSLLEMKEIIETKGGKVLFTYYPNTNLIVNTDPRHSQWLNFIEYVKNNHDIYIDDPYPHFLNNATSTSMVWSLTDKHPSCDAHKLMADHIYKNLILKFK